MCYILKGGTSLKVSPGSVIEIKSSGICVQTSVWLTWAVWDSNGHVVLSLLMVAGGTGKYCLGVTYAPAENRERLPSNSLLLSMQQDQCRLRSTASPGGKGRTEHVSFSVFWPKAASIFRGYDGQLRLERQGKSGGVKILLSRLLSMSHSYLWAEQGTASSCHCGLMCLHLFSSQLSCTNTCPSHYKILMK